MFQNHLKINQQLKEYGVWASQGFFRDKEGNINNRKGDFLENTLIYANQSFLATIQGDNAVYFDYFILGQIIPTLNAPDDYETYECVKDEVK